jgi:signal transduction histidine kinase
MDLITSTISHEMRNPLNSIISQCKIQEQNLINLKNSMREKGINDRVLTNIINEMQESVAIQITSSNLLLYHVEDILGIS